MSDAAMSEREKAFVIDGIVRVAMLAQRLSATEGGKIAVEAAEYARIPAGLVRQISNEFDAFTKIAMPSLRCPLIAAWLARRTIEKARARGDIAMTNREIAIIVGTRAVMDVMMRDIPYSKEAKMLFRIERHVGLEFGLVARLNQERAVFIGELQAAMKPKPELSR